MNHTHKLGLAVVVVAAAALGVALFAQHFEGLTPCALCLIARWPYRIAILAGAAAFALPARYGKYALWFALVCFLADAAVAATHVGVEMGWWKSPLPECSAPSLAGLSGAQLLAALPAKPITPCDFPIYLFPAFKLSFAAMNLIYAAGASLALMLGLGCRRTK
jgi:disulfide bond formation protein DsbB